MTVDNLIKEGSKILKEQNILSHQIDSELLLSKIIKKDRVFVLTNGGIWHLWGHSWEIDENNDWELLDDVLAYVKKKGKEYGAEFLTNGELFENIK